MIENLVLNALKANADLYALINGRIYPDVAQVKTLPCVIMSADSPISPINEPWAYTQNLTFEIYAKTEKSAQDVRNCIYEIMNKFDNYFLTDQTNGVIVRECHAVYGNVSNHFPLENEQAKEKVVSFDIKFTKCA